MFNTKPLEFAGYDDDGVAIYRERKILSSFRVYVNPDNIQETLERIEGLVLLNGTDEFISMVPNRNQADVHVFDVAAAKRFMLDEGWDEEDFVG